jgi:hypothetical protein
MSIPPGTVYLIHDKEYFILRRGRRFAVTRLGDTRRFFRVTRLLPSGLNGC